MKLIIDNSKKNTVLPDVMRASIHLFVRKGIDGTTIKDIAKKAGVAEGALYRHFKSKEDLAWYIFSTQLNRFSMELVAKVSAEKDFKKRIEVFVWECFSAFEENRDLFAYLILREHEELKKFPENYLHPGLVALKILEEAQAEGAAQTYDKYVLGSLFIGGIIRACVVRMYGRIEKDLREHSLEVSECLWRMLKSNP